MKRSRSAPETESLLRATLAGRAAKVTRPAEIPDVGGLRAGRGRLPRWAAPLAAAAVAAAIAGLAVALQHGGEPAPVAAPSGSTSPTPTVSSSGSTSAAPTVAPPPMSGPLSVCSTTLPSPWRQALSTRLNVGSSPYLFAAFSDGRLLIRHGGTDSSRTAALALVSPDGSVDNLLSVSASGGSVTAAADGDWAALMAMQGGGSEGQNAITVGRLVAYNERSGQQTPITLPLSATVDDAAVMDGTVYYDQRGSPRAQTGQVISYDIASGATRVAWQGSFSHVGYPTGPLDTTLQALAGGVYLGVQGGKNTALIAPRSLPRAVARHMTPDIRENLLVADGTSYAWLGGRTLPSSRSLYLWAPGMQAPTHLTLGPGFPELIGGDNGVARFAVQGHWLFAGLQRPTVVDLDTGAMARLPGESTSYDLLEGYLVGVRAGSPNLSRLHLTGLPDLRC